MSELVPITGLWLKEKDGKKYFQGYMGSAKILIFKNTHKTEEKHPDYQMYITAKDKQRDGVGASRQPGDASANYPNKARFQDDIPKDAVSPGLMNDENIPF